MPKRFRSQPNLFRAKKIINKLVEGQESKHVSPETFNCGIVLLAVKVKKLSTRKAKRKLQRLEKKKRRAVHWNRKVASTEVEEAKSDLDVAKIVCKLVYSVYHRSSSNFLSLRVSVGQI